MSNKSEATDRDTEPHQQMDEEPELECDISYGPNRQSDDEFRAEYSLYGDKLDMFISDITELLYPGWKSERADHAYAISVHFEEEDLDKEIHTFIPMDDRLVEMIKQEIPAHHRYRFMFNSGRFGWDDQSGNQEPNHTDTSITAASLLGLGHSAFPSVFPGLGHHPDRIIVSPDGFSLMKTDPYEKQDEIMNSEPKQMTM